MKAPFCGSAEPENEDNEKATELLEKGEVRVSAAKIEKMSFFARFSRTVIESADLIFAL